MATIDTKTSQFLLDLYRECETLKAPEFCAWALLRLRSVIAFDSAMWGHGLANPVVIHDVHIEGQPEEMMQNYAHVKHHDFIAPAAIAASGKTINLYDVITREVYVRHKMYVQHAKRFGMEHILCTAKPEPMPGFISFLSLWRANHNHPFTEEDRMTKQALMEHLVAARRRNVFASVRATLGKSLQSSCTAAICDHDGVLHEADEGFTTTLRRVSSRWTGPKLPANLRAAMRKQPRGRVKSGDHTFEWTPLDHRTLISVHPINGVDTLTRREEEVASLLVRGLNHREISTNIGVSPNTTRTHIATIYKKLGCSNKAEMVVRMLGAEASAPPCAEAVLLS